MVYFMCDCCAATLKKNQIKKHFEVCRQAKVFTCLDCSKNYSGKELDNHTVCKSEAEKYFGKYYEGNKTNNKTVEKWKGWKNEIKYIVKEAGQDGVDKDKLRKQVLEKFVRCHGKKSGLDETFEKKSKFRSFKSFGDRIIYYRYVTNDES